MGLDPASLYTFPILFGSTRHVEIGSGNSTKFARRSSVDNQLSTKIVSIDPHPRAEIDALFDEILRRPLEAVEPALFDRLGSGDILMVDNSHRGFQNSVVSMDRELKQASGGLWRAPRLEQRIQIQSSGFWLRVAANASG
jgi:hypothetical protein